MSAIIINRGSRRTYAVAWPGGDFSGSTIAVLDANLAAILWATIEWTNAATGAAQLTILETLDQSLAPYNMRIVVTSGGVPDTTPPIPVTLL